MCCPGNSQYLTDLNQESTSTPVLILLTPHFRYRRWLKCCSKYIAPVFTLGKVCYVLNEDIICGSAFRKLDDENPSYRLFPDEVQKVPLCQLCHQSGNALEPILLRVNYKRSHVTVALTLGLCGLLIRQRELNNQTYSARGSFKTITVVIHNHCTITGLPWNGVDSIRALDLEEARKKIRDLQSILAEGYPASNLTDEK